MRSRVVVAGPNACGKSTLTRFGAFGALEEIDPDAIARGMPLDVPYGRDVAAAREALKRRSVAVAASRSFLIETTLAGRDGYRLMQTARGAGCGILLQYVCLESPHQAVDRVRNRVARGGHDVPERDIQRRFALPIANLPLAVAISDESYLYDNGDVGAPHRRAAIVTSVRSRTVVRCPTWAINALLATASLRREMDSTKKRGIGRNFQPRRWRLALPQAP